MLVETAWYTEPNNRAASDKGSKLRTASRTPVLTVRVCEAEWGEGMRRRLGGVGGVGGVGATKSVQAVSTSDIRNECKARSQHIQG